MDNERREFLKRVGLAGASLGLPMAASGADGPPSGVPGDALTAPLLRPGGGARRTLFFDLSHLDDIATAHVLVVSGRRYPLVPVRRQPSVLAAARTTSRLLRRAGDAVTHHATNVWAPTDAVALAYISCGEDAAKGTWAMAGMHFLIPQRAFSYAYAQARAMVPSGPLPPSAKRRKYGVSGALSLQELLDEDALVDSTNFAAGLMGVHPDVLSLEPLSAAHIHVNHIAQESDELAALLAGMGPAVPDGAAPLSDAPPWARLLPFESATPGKLVQMSSGLNVYSPDWAPEVDQVVGPAIGRVIPPVKNDATLGFDVTGVNLNDPTSSRHGAAGAIWARHDGRPTVYGVADAPSAVGEVPRMVFRNQSAETGLAVRDPTMGVASGGRRKLVLDNVSNWFLRWLGVWVQFVGPDGAVLPLKSLPNDTYPSEPGPYPRAQDKPEDEALFLGVLSPALAVMGIPIQPGSFSPMLYLPQGASTVRIFYTGFGFSGSAPESPSVERFYDAGCLMTTMFNYGTVGLFMAAGVSTYSPFFKNLVSIGGGSIALAISTLVKGIVDQSTFVAGLGSFTTGLLKILLQTGGNKTITAVVEALAEILVESEIIDNLPLAGQIARAVAAVVGAIQIAETSIELALSPPAYEFECASLHDFEATFVHDSNSQSFPLPAADETIYYKVTYLFDNGTPHVQDGVEFDPTQKSLTVRIAGIPYGGMINVSIGIYLRKKFAKLGVDDDWCAAHGTTGLVANTVDFATGADGSTQFAVVENKVPISARTAYRHSHLTALDSAGNHVWREDSTGSLAPPYVKPPGGQLPGLAGLNGITVRQGTARHPGYVGYAWSAINRGSAGCSASGAQDQLANLNTSLARGGAAAQDGYFDSRSTCLGTGVDVAYSLLSGGALNVYLDTSTMLLRPITLDPPGFAPPGGMAVGQLALSESSRCLLHPAGHVVSLSRNASMLETLRLPPQVRTDADAKKHLLARTHGGPGHREGLLDQPVSAAIAADGTIIVLEAGNSRLQAFDLGGNPVRYFSGQRNAYFLELDLPDGWEFLDLAVEFTGYLYVLARSTGGDHRMEIYHRAQAGTTPINRTLGLNAARIAVDFWRGVYALNYTVLKQVDGKLPEITEPSVSLWLPSAP